MRTLPTRISEKDINAHAALILNDAVRAVSHILKRRAAMDRKGERDAPLVVLAGEDHTVPAYRLLFLKMLDALHSREDILVCQEIETRLVHDVYADHIKARVEIIPELSARDHRGALSLKSHMSCIELHGGHHTQHILNNAILRNDIPVMFNDAAFRTQGAHEYIDDKDPDTRASMQACLNGRTLPRLHLNTQASMHLRNHHMVTQALQSFSKHSPRIMIQQCGARHIGGDYDFCSPVQSLGALWAKNGTATTALINHGIIPADTPSLAQVDKIRMFDFSILPDYTTPPDAPKLRHAAHGAEAAYSNAILQRMGIGQYCVGNDERRENEYTYLNEVIDIFDNIKAARAQKPTGQRAPSRG